VGQKCFNESKFFSNLEQRLQDFHTEILGRIDDEFVEREANKKMEKNEFER
jgi:hypothetical protein